VPTRRAVTLPVVTPIVPVIRDQPFDDSAYLFEPKYDGFRGLFYLSGRECHFGSKCGNVLRQIEQLCYWVREECGSRRQFSMARSWRWIQRAGRTSAASSRAGEISTTPLSTALAQREGPAQFAAHAPETSARWKDVENCSSGNPTGLAPLEAIQWTAPLHCRSAVHPPIAFARWRHAPPHGET
jgi:hypothetical protein